MKDIAKQAAAERAVSLIEEGMIVGLGTGSTAEYFIRALASTKISLTAVVASSSASQTLAKKLHLPVRDLNEMSHVDVTVDGADEVDPSKRLIKGRGGALVREKILAAASRKMLVIVDEKKLVPRLGQGVLPVEIIPFGSNITKLKLASLGYEGKWHQGFSENGNLRFDIQFACPPESPETTHVQIKTLEGVVDTGFFLGLANCIIVGHIDGTSSIH